MVLKDYYNSFLEAKRKEGLAPNSLKKYERMLFGSLSHSVERKKILDLKKTDVLDVIEAGKRHGEYGPTDSVVVFRQLMKFLEDSGVEIPFNWLTISVPAVRDKEQPFLTEEEFEIFISEIDLTEPDGLRDRALYELLWATGTRIGEALLLDRDCVKDNEAIIRNIKTNDDGRIYFSKRCLEWVGKYLETRKDDNEALFISHWPKIKRLSRQMAIKNLAKRRKKSKIGKRITNHAFRRSFASLLLDRGATVKETQYLCRHRSERTTLRHYIKLETRKAKLIYQKIYNENFDRSKNIGCG